MKRRTSVTEILERKQMCYQQSTERMNNLNLQWRKWTINIIIQLATRDWIVKVKTKVSYIRKHKWDTNVDLHEEPHWQWSWQLRSVEIEELNWSMKCWMTILKKLKTRFKSNENKNNYAMKDVGVQGYEMIWNTNMKAKMKWITIVEESRTRMISDHPSAGLLLKELTRLEKFETLSFIEINLMSLKS